MALVMRNMVKDYINVTPGVAEPTWTGMFTGFTAIDENANVQTDTKTYVSDAAGTTNILRVEPTFPFTTDVYTDQAAVMYLHDLFRNQKVGSDTITDYIRTDYTVDEDGEPVTPTVPARKFSVSVQVDDETGAGGENLVLSGILSQRGNFVDGTFNIDTEEFKPTGVVTPE